MTRMVVGLVLLAYAGGCSRTPARATAPVEAVARGPGLYGRLAAEPGTKMKVYRAGVREPIAIVSLDEPFALALPEGVYVAVLEGGTRRVFGVSAGPITLAGGMFDPWTGEDPTVAALEVTHRRWFQWLLDEKQEPKALRSKAHAEIVTSDLRLRRLQALAAEAVFADGGTPTSVPILDDLPAPDDPALALIHEFAGPVFLAAKFGDDAAKQKAQAWLDTAARTNPEPGARVMALFYALETARLTDPANGIARRYAWIPELDLEASAMLEIIDAYYAPDRLARPGAELPAFTLVELDDPSHQVDRTALEGDLVLLHLWATWCRPCLETIPELQRVHDALNADARRIQFVSINLDEDPALARAYLQAHPMPWTHLHGGPIQPDVVMRTFGLLGPSMLLVDRDRRILATTESLHDALESTLRAALEAAPGATSSR